FLLFIVSNVSGILAMYLNSISIVLSVFMAFVFLVLYFGIQLTLFKHIFQVLDRSQEDIRWRDSIPTVKDMAYFFACVISIMVGTFLTYLLISVVFFPLIYLISVEVMVQIVYFITFILAFCMFLRIAFFPFFI